MKDYMIGVTIIRARDAASAKKKYARLVKKTQRAEQMATRRWLESRSTKRALGRLTSGR